MSNRIGRLSHAAARHRLVLQKARRPRRQGKKTVNKRLVCLVLGVPMAANGLWMLVDPAGWYATVPGPSGTGPFNPHFVRDIGAAYATAGGAIALAAFVRAAAATALATTGGAFLGIHALVHGWERAAGVHPGTHDLAPELILVWMPAVLVLAAAYWLYRRAKEGLHD
jgi:hypothetical protein